jgi:hypothetical protein
MVRARAHYVIDNFGMCGMGAKFKLGSSVTRSRYTG